MARAAAGAAAGQEPDDDQGDNRHPHDAEGVRAEQGENHEDREDDNRHWHAGGPGRSGAGRGRGGGAGHGSAGHGGLAPRQVGEQGGQVRGGAGLDHLDDILGVDGVDGVFVGPYDLALSLGRESVLDGAVVSAIESVIGRTRGRGRITGIFTGNRELARLLPAVDLLGVDTDAAALRAGLTLMFGGSDQR